jgi:hypothetical protein
VIVSKDQARWIDQGKATLVCRPISESDWANGVPADYKVVRRPGHRTELRKPAPRPKPAHELGERHLGLIPIKTSRVDQATCHVIVTAVERARIRDLTVDHAKRMGYRTLSAFKAAWVRLYDPTWVQRQEHPADGAMRALDLEELALRFHERFINREVWAISIEVDRDPPVLLAASSDELYVVGGGRALRGEPEAVNVEALGEWAKVSETVRQAARGRRGLQDRRRSTATRIRQTASPEQLDRIEQVLAETDTEEEAAA